MKTKLRITGLTNLELKELQQVVSNEEVLIDKEDSGHRHGDPLFLAASLVVSSVAVQALVAIIAGRSKRENQTKLNVEVVRAEETIKVQYESNSTDQDAVRAEVVSALGDAMGVDPSSLGL